MDSPPRRLKAQRLTALRPTTAEEEEKLWPSKLGSRNRRVIRAARASRRATLILLWTLLAMIPQSVMIWLPGRGKIVFARVYWSGICRLIGLRLRAIGSTAHPAAGVARSASSRPIVYVSNHSSWLDIAVLGARLDACFISKDEVSRYPLVNLVARLGRTVFVQRQRTSTARERDDMLGRLAGGDNLVLFPEGTTSDGSRVLPFRSAFFSIVEKPVTADGLPPIVQPVSVVYDRLAYLPTGRASRPLFAWYGDMSLGPHFWRLAQQRGLRATVLLHPPIDPRAYPSRKALAHAVWATVADGAATLRQNRPVPANALGGNMVTEDSTRPAFA